jgi:hypothetical protein
LALIYGSKVNSSRRLVVYGFTLHGPKMNECSICGPSLVAVSQLMPNDGGEGWLLWISIVKVRSMCNVLVEIKKSKKIAQMWSKRAYYLRQVHLTPWRQPRGFPRGSQWRSRRGGRAGCGH